LSKGREPFVEHVAEVGSVRQGDPIAHVVSVFNKELDNSVKRSYNTYINNALKEATNGSN
jgi:hypothetical protein